MITLNFIRVLIRKIILLQILFLVIFLHVNNLVKSPKSLIKA